MTSEPGEDDPVSRNRATPRRHVPGRRGLGDDVTRRVQIVTVLVLVLATTVLAWAMLTAR